MPNTKAQGFVVSEDFFILSVQHLTPGSDFIWPFLPPYMGFIPNPKMAFIFPVSCILVLIFQNFMIYFPKMKEKVASQNPK